MLKHALIPFPGSAMDEEKRFRLSAEARSGKREGRPFYELHFLVEPLTEAVPSVSLNEVILPSESAAGQRRDGLWEHTCFEAFIGSTESPYFEWNAATSGAWNFYRFENYRLGMKPVRVLPTGELPKVSFERKGEQLSVRCELPVSLFSGFSDNPETLSFCIVLETSRGISYWSTTHAGPKPDFHLAESRKISFSSICSS